MKMKNEFNSYLLATSGDLHEPSHSPQKPYLQCDNVVVLYEHFCTP